MSFTDAHWHLLFNHWPILGPMLALLVLAYGLARRLPAVVTLSYWLLLLMAVATVQAGQAALALLGLAWPWARRARFWPALVLAVTVLTSRAMAYVGSLGGLVRHTELRDNPRQRPDGQPVGSKAP